MLHVTRMQQHDQGILVTTCIMQGQNHPSYCLDRFTVNLRYLVDGKPSKIVMAMTLLVSSPDHDIINGY